MATFCILDSGGNVMTVFGCRQQSPTPPGYVEISVDGGQIGQVWNGERFVTSTAPAPIPQLVSGIQLRMAVDGSSEYAAIKSFLTSQSQAIQDAYAGTGQFNRNDVLLASIITAGVLTGAQVDALFVAAAGITV